MYTTQRSGGPGRTIHRAVHPGLLAVLLLAAASCSGAGAEVTVAGAPVEGTTDWRVTVNGQPVPVHAVTVFHGGPAYFCLFLTDGPAHVEARPNWPVRNAVVRPLSRGIVSELAGDTIAFGIDGPCYLSVEPNGLINHPLFVFADAPIAEPPSPHDPDVLHFGPGLHTLAAPTVLETGDEIYLAAGAWVKVVMPEDEEPIRQDEGTGRRQYQPLFRSGHADRIRIRGRGVLDMSALDWKARCAMHFNAGKNVRIEGITILDCPSWTVLISQCEDVHIENLKLLGHRQGNDGINLVNCRNAIVSNCFLRLGDDGVVMKTSAGVGPGQDVLVERCVIWNDKVRCIGVTSFAAEPIRDIVFRDIDIIHDLTTTFDEASTMAIRLEDRGPVTNITFEDIRCEDSRGKLIQVRVEKGRWSTTEELGYVEGVLFKDIQYLGTNHPESVIRGSSPQHCVKNVRFENLTFGGKLVRSAEEANLQTNEYVYGVAFMPGSE